MNYYKLPNNTLTLKSGYFVSGISLVLIFLFSTFFEIIINYCKSSVSFELLRQEINKKSYNNALKVSIHRLEPNIPNKMLSLIFYSSFPTLTQVAKQKHLPHNLLSSKIQNQIFSIGSLAKRGDFEEALLELKNIKKSLSILGLLKNKDINESINNTYELLDSLRIESANYGTFDTDKEDLKSKEIRLKRRHVLLAEEFGIFLSLKPLNEKGKELEVYKSGVLEGLPVLKDLKDDIATLPLLKEELDKIGGSVNIQAPNAYEIFTGRLLSLKDRSKQIRNEYEQAIKSITLLDKEKIQTKDAIKNKKFDIDENISKLILALNK